MRGKVLFSPTLRAMDGLITLLAMEPNIFNDNSVYTLSFSQISYLISLTKNGPEAEF